MLKQALLILAIVASHPAVYVKGHSHAAAKTRRNLEELTCYTPASTLEGSDAVLEVDHLLTPAGDGTVVMVLLDSHGKVLWEGKTEEDPLPLRAPVNRLLKRLARSTCPGHEPMTSWHRRAASGTGN